MLDRREFLTATAAVSALGMVPAIAARDGRARAAHHHRRTGHKTGTGRAEGTTNKCNDVAITYPPGRSPVIIAAYYDSGEYTPQIEARHEAVLAAVGRIAADWAVG